MPPPPRDLVELLRHVFSDALADEAGPALSREVTLRLVNLTGPRRMEPPQLLDAIRAAWSTLPAAESLPADRRDALLHRLTSAVIATYYEHR